MKVLVKEDCFVGSLQTEVDFEHVKALPEKGLKTGKKSKCTTYHAPNGLQLKSKAQNPSIHKFQSYLESLSSLNLSHVFGRIGPEYK